MEHLPQPSAWPFVVGSGVTLMGLGVVTNLALSLAGIVVMIWGLVGWVRELRHG